MQKWVICLFIAYRCSDIPKGDSNNMRYTGSGTFQLLLYSMVTSASPPVFIYSMPGYTCSIKERMLYSSCKNRLLDEVERDYQLEVTKKVNMQDQLTLHCSKWFGSTGCWWDVLFTDGDRQWRRPDRGIPVRGGPPNGPHLKAGLLQAPWIRREEGQQTHHQGGWREWRGELGTTHGNAHEKKIKPWHRNVLVDCFIVYVFTYRPTENVEFGHRFPIN